MEKRFRIGISGSYGGMNLGDESILSSMVAQLRESVAAEITVFSRDPDDTVRRHTIDRAVNVRTMTREEALAEVQRLDALILGGGGILYDGEVQRVLREVFLAQEEGVPVFVYAVSAGPLTSPESRELVRTALDNAVVVTVRDRRGRRILEEAGVKHEIRETADPALLLEPAPVPPEVLERHGFDSGRRRVGISVREPGPAAPELDVEHYHRLLANAADFIADRLEAELVFFPLERRNDIPHSHAVISRMQYAQRASVLRGEYTSGQILTLLGQMDFAVGMRLHFLIFAALEGVPFVALPYAAKVTGLLESLALEMPPLREARTGSLLAMIDRAWDRQDEIRGHLASRLPELQELARETHRLLVRFLHDQVTPAARTAR